MEIDNLVLVTGGFDPVHSGHLQLINDARNYGRVIIGLNSDAWLTRKKGAPFLPYVERLKIMQNFKNVFFVVDFDDSDDTACDAIRKVKELFPKNKIIFANGGDRDSKTTPELLRYSGDPQVQFLFEIGGNTKLNSSSTILNTWKNNLEERPWGVFYTHYSTGECKVKRLLINPGSSISMQYHNNRSEFWFVESGSATVYTLDGSTEVKVAELGKHQYHSIEKFQWHRLENTGNDLLSVIEIQYGTTCTESDIIRLQKT